MSQRPKCSVFVATSVDGFIARLDGRIDWLNELNRSVPAGEDCGYSAFVDEVDALVMGRATFEQARAFDPWPYGELPVFVLAHGACDVPSHLRGTVSCSSDSPRALVTRLANAGHRHLYIDGGRVVQSFLLAGLIDEITVTTVPILLGEGRSLFSTACRELKLELVRSRAWEFGFVQNVWRVHPIHGGKA